MGKKNIPGVYKEPDLNLAKGLMMLFPPPQ